MKIVEIITAFWGERYCNLIDKTMLPSIYQKGNLPDLEAAGYEIRHIVCCPPEEAVIVAPAYERRGLKPEFQTHFVKAGVEATLCQAYKESISRGNIALVCSGDTVMATGLAKVVQRMKPGHFVICAHPRIREQEWQQVSEFITKHPENDDWVKFAMERVQHQMVDYGKKQDPRQYWRAFRRDGFWEVNFCDPAPIGWFGEPWMLDSWVNLDWLAPHNVIDHQLPDAAFSRGTLMMIRDSRQLLWFEMTDENRDVLPCPGGLKTNLMQHLDKLPCLWWDQDATLL